MKRLSILKLATIACAALGLGASYGSGSGSGTGKVGAQTAHMSGTTAPAPCANGNHIVAMRKAGGDPQSTHRQAQAGHDCAFHTLTPGAHKLNPQPLPPG
ncbi:MAG TPA: hypothetical protein VII73_09315 [Caulobacteraceae bacterium]